MKKLICFDLDGTLTQHRSPLGEKNKAVLDKLAKKYKIIMVGAGNAPRIYKQMNEYPIDILGNYGMQESKIIDGKFTIIREDVTNVDKEFFIEKINYLRAKYGTDEKLRRAWGDDTVSIDNPKVPDAEARYIMYGVDYDLKHQQSLSNLPAPVTILGASFLTC